MAKKVEVKEKPKEKPKANPNDAKIKALQADVSALSARIDALVNAISHAKKVKGI